MSFSIDANVLLYASDRASEFHERAIAFLEQACRDTEIFCVSWLTVMAYLRIATHGRIFGTPLTPAQAMSNVEDLLQQANVRTITERDGFLSTYRSVTGKLSARGNLVPDAHLATILRQNEVSTLYTHDRDFLRFRFLTVKDPFEHD